MMKKLLMIGFALMSLKQGFCSSFYNENILQDSNESITKIIVKNEIVTLHDLKENMTNFVYNHLDDDTLLSSYCHEHKHLGIKNTDKDFEILLQEAKKRVPYQKAHHFFNLCSEWYFQKTTDLPTKISISLIIPSISYYFLYYINGLNGKIEPSFGKKIEF